MMSSDSYSLYLDTCKIAHNKYLGLQRQGNQKDRKANITKERYVYIEEHQIIQKFVKKSFPESKSVLCVGAREESELVMFDNIGFEKVVGIDLFKRGDRLLNVDMHDVSNNFEENEFEIFYSSHSLEHALNPRKVIEGLRRVSRHGGIFILPTCRGKFKPTGHTVMIHCCKKEEFNNESAQQFIDELMGVNFGVVTRTGFWMNPVDERDEFCFAIEWN